MPNIYMTSFFNFRVQPPTVTLIEKIKQKKNPLLQQT